MSVPRGRKKKIFKNFKKKVGDGGGTGKSGRKGVLMAKEHVKDFASRKSQVYQETPKSEFGTTGPRRRNAGGDVLFVTYTQTPFSLAPFSILTSCPRLWDEADYFGNYHFTS